jgi:hypothetical protein
MTLQMISLWKGPLIGKVKRDQLSIVTSPLMEVVSQEIIFFQLDIKR